MDFLSSMQEKLNSLPVCPTCSANLVGQVLQLGQDWSEDRTWHRGTGVPCHPFRPCRKSSQLPSICICTSLAPPSRRWGHLTPSLQHFELRNKKCSVRATPLQSAPSWKASKTSSTDFSRALKLRGNRAISASKSSWWIAMSCSAEN